MSDTPPELGRIAFHLDQGSAQGGLFLTLGKRLLEQTPKTVLLSCNPQEVLNLLSTDRYAHLGDGARLRLVESLQPTSPPHVNVRSTE